MPEIVVVSSERTGSLHHLSDQRLDVKFIGNVSGKYSLGNTSQYPGKSVRVFACRTQSISPRLAVLSGPVRGQIGERVSAVLDHVGLITGKIARHVDGGFALEIAAEDAERGSLAARIAWLKRKNHSGITDNRQHKRVMPRQPQSILVLSDGRIVNCFVADMSVSGAAISADIDLPDGTPVAVGTVVSRVIRQLETGFAVRFKEVQDVTTLESRLIKPLPSNLVLNA